MLGQKNVGRQPEVGGAAAPYRASAGVQPMLSGLLTPLGLHHRGSVCRRAAQLRSIDRLFDGYFEQPCKAGKLARQLTQADAVILDKLGYLPFPESGGALLLHMVSRL